MNESRKKLVKMVTYWSEQQTSTFPKTLRFKVYSDDLFTEETSYYVDVPCYDGGVCNSEEEFQSFMQNFDPNLYPTKKINVKDLGNYSYDYFVGHDGSIFGGGKVINVGVNSAISDGNNCKAAVVLINIENMYKQSAQEEPIFNTMLDNGLIYACIWISEFNPNNFFTIDIGISLSDTSTQFIAPQSKN